MSATGMTVMVWLAAGDSASGSGSAGACPVASAARPVAATHAASDASPARPAPYKRRLLVERRDVDFLEAKFFGFGDAALDLADGADLAAQAHLGGEAYLRRDIQVEV